MRALLAAVLLFALAARGEDAPCLAAAPAACAACHKDDAAVRYGADRMQPCAGYCGTCHAPKEMGRHHSIGSRLERTKQVPLRLDGQGRTTCATCHQLGRPRYDARPWKAESLFDRLFRRQDRHKTYLLAVRNDRGQLCKACH